MLSPTFSVTFIAVLFVSIVGLVGCATTSVSQSAGVAGSVSEETKSHARPVTGIVQPIEIILGNWHGLYSCQGFQYVVDLKVTQVSGMKLHATLTAQVFTLDGKSYRVPGGETEESLQGSYHPELSLFTLTTNRVKNPRSNLSFIGVVDPTSGRFAAVLQPNKDRCSYLIAGRGNMKPEVKAIVQHAMGPVPRSQLRDGQRCDKPIAEWLSHPLAYEQLSLTLHDQYSSIYGGLELAQDANFVPYFGKSFSKLSAAEISDMEYQVGHGCWQKFERSGKPSSIGSVLGLLRSSPSRAELAIYTQAKAIVSNWKRRAVTALNVYSRSASQEVTRAGANILPILWPIGEYDIRNDVLAKQNSTSSDLMLAELKVLTDKSQPDFLYLARLAAFTETIGIGKTSFPPAPQTADEKREAALAQKAEDSRVLRYQVTPESLQQAEALIRRTIGQYVLPAAESFAHSTSTIEHAQNDLSDLASGTHRALVKYLDVTQRSQIDTIFRTRKAVLLADFSSREMAYFESQIKSSTATVADLQRTNSYQTQLQARYRSLLAEPAFAALNARLHQSKQALLANNLDAIQNQLTAASSIRDMDQVLGTYLQPGDVELAATASLAKLYDARKEEFAPFTRLEGGEYLNAIYSGDLAELRRQDSVYVGNLQMATMQFMGPKDFRTKLLNEKYERISLSTPVLATYLFNYQRLSAACLADDAVAFTVTEMVPGSVTTNGLGVELYRTFGYTNEYHYSVNKEFAAIFRQIGDKGSGNVMTSLLDIFVNDNKLGKIKQGVKQMMEKFPCNGQVIQNMEMRMREVFYKVK